MFEFIFFLLLLIYSVDSEINSSADLNCNFAVDCLWRNGTNGVEDSGEFAPGTSLQMDDYHKVTALRSDRDDPFIYSSAFGGRQTALLVSDVVSCQLGGASLKYWYWKTGTDAKLDICIRQPPGSRDPSALKCYDGLASTHAQQWIYRSVEFPPISQPFEFLFRATFTAPMDIIALDDINYDAILCDVRRGDEARQKRRVMLSVHERNQPLIVAGIDRDADVEALRLKRGSPPTIGWNDWWKLKASGNLGKQTMIVVSEAVPETNTTATTDTTTTTTVNPLAALFALTTPATTTVSPLAALLNLIESTTEKTTPRIWLDDELAKRKTTTTTTTESTATFSQEQHLANMMTFLKGVAPVLPYVPTIVQTLQSLDPRTAASFSAPPPHSFASPTLGGVAPIVPKIGNTKLSILPNQPTNDHADSLISLAKRFRLDKPESSGLGLNSGSGSALDSVLDSASGSSPDSVSASGSYKDEDRQLNDVDKNAFGFRRFSTPEFSTIYPPKIHEIQKKTLPPEVESIVEEDGINMSDLSPEEIKQLEAIHRKIFKHVPTSTQPNLVIYKKIPKPQVKPIDQPRILKEIASPQLRNVLNELPNNPKYAKIAPEMIDKFKEIASGLPPEVLNDMSQIQNIPNVDELVEGLDLELIRTPAGFQKIKNEFIARYMRRMMGLPVVMNRALPPPPQPMRISRKLFRQMMAKSMRART